MQLHPRATAAGIRLIAHDVLGSTNTEALALACQGEYGPLWITAERQTAGRGRRGRAWTSLYGNLHASLLLVPAGPREAWPQLSFVAGLATHDAVSHVAGDLADQLALKWPNDILLNRRKVAGILIEGPGGCSGGPGAVAIGVGVNCATHPQDTDFPAASLSSAAATAESVLVALSDSMLLRLAQWDGGRGFAAVRADWLARAVGVGDELRVQLVDHDLVGRFETLDANGALVLRLRDRIATIAAGDVFLPQASPSGTAA